MTDKHPDGGGDIGQAAVTPAATVLLLRESPGLEVLMLHKSSRVAFGGMWVFPGGKIDDDDYVGPGDQKTAARNAAARETGEEAGIRMAGDNFVWFAHWTPPLSTARRFATWFFVAATQGEHSISVDGGEIQHHQWVTPAHALKQQADGKIALAPPTWVSLYQLSKFQQINHAISTLSSREPRYYRTRLVKAENGTPIALWAGDAGYADGKAEISGPTHRLIMKRGGFEFRHSAVGY